MKDKVLFMGILGLCLAAGCGGATQQWVKDYVGRETISVKTEFRERIQPLEQGLTDNKAQIEALRKDVANIGASLGTLRGKLDELSKSIADIAQGYKTEVGGVRQDMERDIKDLNEKVNALRDHLGKLGSGLETFRKSIELLTKRLEAFTLPPPVPPQEVPKKK